MSDNDGKKPLGLGGGSGRSGQVKQSFSHGRTHNVVVETKRKRVVVPGKSGAAAGGARSGSSSVGSGDPSKRPAGISDAEMERRLAALKAAKAREVEEAAQREAEEKAREEERERRRLELEAKEREEREREEALRLKAEEDERRAREAELREKKKAEVRAKPVVEARPAAPADRAAAEAAASRAETKGVSAAPRKTDRDRDTRSPSTDDRDSRNKSRDDNRRTGKLSLSQALNGEGGRQRSLAAMKRKQEKARQKAMGGAMRAEKQVRDVQLPETIMVSELANRMAERTPDVIKSLMRMG
ncbi:MAG: translation initiation factor IF-2 associated domain-containing protein, partial [Paracoccus sp.]|nr:translation initiation factor IF-2 associated domain-containing protein [Paracoccus sp. (in: a-proteobacteria)]